MHCCFFLIFYAVSIDQFVAYTVKASSFAGIISVFNLQSSVKFTNCDNYDAALWYIFDYKSTFWNHPYVNLQNNTQSKEQYTWTCRFYGYTRSAVSALLATGLVGPVLLGSFVRCSLAVRIEGTVVSILTLGRAVQHSGNERTTVVFLLWVLPLVCSIHCGLLSTVVPARIVMGILHPALDYTFANCSVSLRLPMYG